MLFSGNFLNFLFLQVITFNTGKNFCLGIQKNGTKGLLPSHFMKAHIFPSLFNVIPHKYTTTQKLSNSSCFSFVKGNFLTSRHRHGHYQNNPRLWLPQLMLQEHADSGSCSGGLCPRTLQEHADSSRQLQSRTRKAREHSMDTDSGIWRQQKAKHLEC